MLSAGRPVCGFVIATRLRHVSAAHVRTVALSRERTAFGPVDRRKAGAWRAEVVDADAAGASAKAATEAAPPTSKERRLGVWRVFGVRSVRSAMGLYSVSDYLRPVVAMPSMKRFWKMRKTTRTGMMTTVAPARSRP